MRAPRRITRKRKAASINGARALMADRKKRKDSLKSVLPDCKFCPTCQRAIVPDSAPLSPTQRRILRIMERHGEIPAEVLHNALWGSDPNGGPSMGTLYTQICQMNRVLAGYGLSVTAKCGGRDLYQFLPLPQTEAAE